MTAREATRRARRLVRFARQNLVNADSALPRDSRELRDVAKDQLQAAWDLLDRAMEVDPEREVL